MEGCDKILTVIKSAWLLYGSGLQNSRSEQGVWFGHYYSHPGKR